MNVAWSAECLAALEAELQVDGRPTIAHFDQQLRIAIEMEFATLWDDLTKVGVDPATGLRIVRTDPAPPYMFPPGVHYARVIDHDTVEILAVDFDWNFWVPEGEENPLN